MSAQSSTNPVPHFTPQELSYGEHQLRDSLREDIVQIEKELTEGWLGSVPDYDAWEAVAVEAFSLQVSHCRRSPRGMADLEITCDRPRRYYLYMVNLTNSVTHPSSVLPHRTSQDLGEKVIDAQKHIQLKNLKGFMAPVRKAVPGDTPEAPPEYGEFENPNVEAWRNAVRTSQTLAR